MSRPKRLGILAAAILALTGAFTVGTTVSQNTVVREHAATAPLVTVAFAQFDASNGRLILSIAAQSGTIRPRVAVDGQELAGSWSLSCCFGILYTHTDGKYGLPGLDVAKSHAVTAEWDYTATATGATVTVTGTTTTTSSSTTTTLPPTTTTTTPPVVSTHGRLGVQQPEPTGLKLLDAINDHPNHHADWVRVEAQVPKGGAWDYAYFDRILTAARTQGMKVMLGVNYVPLDIAESGWVASWGSEVAAWPRTGANQAAWVQREVALVSYLAPKYGQTLAAVEQSNEPQGWEFGSARGKYPFTASQYVALLNLAYPKIKAVAPWVIVTTGGTAPGTTQSANGGTIQIAPNDWYPALKSAGAAPGKSFDVFAVHAYDGVNACYSQCLDRIAGTWPGVQLWATEQGRGGDDPNWVGSNIDAWRAKSYSGVWFEFTWADRNCTASGFDGYGLKRCDGTKKNAYSAFATRAP